ncbi:MAG TPA: hypothetical protein DCP63_08905 [Bacteroidetes bacterium]|nr:hypothetical protein [Bacteroidota bacterium]
MVNRVYIQVMGCDTTILPAAPAGQLELDLITPAVAFNLLHEIEILGNAINVFGRLRIIWITANWCVGLRVIRRSSQTPTAVWGRPKSTDGRSNSLKLADCRRGA